LYSYVLIYAKAYYAVIRNLNRQIRMTLRKAKKGSNRDNPPNRMGKPTDDEVIEAIGALADSEKPRWSAGEIRKMLEGNSNYRGKVPTTDRAIQIHIKKWREMRGEEPWSLDKAKTGDILPVLETLAAVMAVSEGGIKHITVKEAEFIVKVREAAPNLDPLISWRVAREYIRRIAEKKQTLDIDGFLAIQNLPEDRKDQGQKAFERAFGDLPFIRQIIFARAILTGRVDLTAKVTITKTKEGAANERES
jgi:hypothetical protein